MGSDRAIEDRKDARIGNEASGLGTGETSCVVEKRAGQVEANVDNTA